MNINELFNNLTDEQIQDSSKVINTEISKIIDTGEFKSFFPEQEIIYFNTLGFDIGVSTILSSEKEKFESISEDEQENFPKIEYKVILNLEEPTNEKELAEYSPFKLYIAPHKDLELGDEKETEYLDKFKEAVMKLIEIILGVLYKKLELEETTH